MVTHQQHEQHLKDCQDCNDHHESIKKKIMNHIKKNPKLDVYQCQCCGFMQHAYCFTCSYFNANTKQVVNLHIYWLRFKKLFWWLNQ